MSGYDWSGNPTPIYRYDIAAAVVDLVVDTGMPDQMVNNLAVYDSTLIVGAGHGSEFWRADALTGEVRAQGTYTPEVSALLMDGAFRKSSGRLFRADALGRLLESDTEGQVISIRDVADGGGLTGLEFVGDRLYGTNDAGLGSMENEPDWTFTVIPLSGIVANPGVFIGGLAYDEESDVLYMAAYQDGVATLYSVLPDEGTATRVRVLPDAGYPSGAWPQAMGWVGDDEVDIEKVNWGRMKSRYR